jgi:YidC/Oxa1 family membrane protein insertase
MVIANIFQALQTFLLTREALPDNLQSILDDQRLQSSQPAAASAGGGSSSGRMPFEPKGGNK